MQPVIVTLFFVSCVFSQPTAEKRRLDPDAIMADVYSNNRAFADFDFKMSPDLYDDVLDSFRRLERDFPDVPEDEPAVVLPTDEPHIPVVLPLSLRPHIFPKVKSRFFRMF